MTPLQTYGPVARERLVVPVDPVRGWAAADLGRRVAAVLAVPLAATLSLLSLRPGTALPDWALLGWLALGPATFYSLARVVRPEPRSPERTPRHLLAAAGTALAFPTVIGLLVPTGDVDVIVVYGSGAGVLGVLTATWGLVALAVRAAAR